jgi:phage-related minor tail protein
LEANLKQAESKISELTTEMGKKVTVLTAGVIAAVASLIGAGLSYLGVQAGIKPTDDSKPKKRKVMDL